MEPKDLLEDYVVRPAEVARTLLMSVDDWDGRPLCTRAPANSTPLFSLYRSGEKVILKWPPGSFHITFREVEKAMPDPLWESAHGICHHMEKDHADTFAEFLRQLGWHHESDSPTLMPWVEKRGFFLCNPDCLAWIRFPEECPTPNEVRKTMIRMLKEIRNE